MKNVSVPASFWVKAGSRDYQKPATAWAREVLQNSRDAGATAISFVVSEEGEHLVVDVVDNGRGMTEEIIEKKLMALGETSKSAESGDTGGFGVAKILLFFSQVRYEIWTNDLYLEGHSGNYRIASAASVGASPIRGTRLRVVLNPDVMGTESKNNLIALWEHEIKKSHLPGITVTINGNHVEASSSKGRLIKDLGEGIKLYRRPLRDGQGKTNQAHVRVNGLYMFSIWTADTRFRVVVELTGYSLDHLTSYRDALSRRAERLIMGFVQELAINSAAGDQSTTKMTLWSGRSSRGKDLMGAILTAVNERVFSGSPEQVEEAIVLAATGAGATPEVAAGILAVFKQQGASDEQAGETEDHETVCYFHKIELQDVAELADSLDHHYYVRTVGKYRRCPAKWSPSRFTAKQKALLEAWGKVVGMALEDAGYGDSKFDVGFVLDDGSMGDDLRLATYLNHDGRHIFLINPERYGSDKRLPRLSSEEMVTYLISLATHEVTHRSGLSGHGESFSYQELEYRRRAMKRMGQYRKAVAGVVAATKSKAAA